MTAPPRRRLAVALAAAPFVAAWFAACGGSEPPQVTSGGDAAIEASGATGDASPRPDGGAAADVGVGADADASARCAQLETRDTDCKKPFKPKACLFLDCYDRLFSAADSAALTSCIVGRPCDKSDDDCFAEVTAKYAGDTGGVAFQAACLAKRDACLEGGAGFVDDYCVGRVYAMLTDRPAYDVCITKPCDQVKDCFNAVYASAGCPP